LQYRSRLWYRQSVANTEENSSIFIVIQMS